jgi:hypothetical protein
MRPPPAPVAGGAGSGPAAAAEAPVVAGDAAGYQRRRQRRWERGEGTEVGGGMRASDIGGVGGPAATPAPGPSLERQRLPVVACGAGAECQI